MRKNPRNLVPGDVVCLPNYEVITVTRTYSTWTKLHGPVVEVHYVAEDGLPMYVELPEKRTVAVRSPEVQP